MRLATVLCVFGSLASMPVSLAARQDHHGSSDQRAAKAMGFDQDRTTHHFLLFNDGGAIDVGVKDPADTKNRDAMRVLGVRDRGGAPCLSVRAVLGERLEALNRRIDEMLGLRDELCSLVTDWDGRLAHTPKGERAHLLETLEGRGGHRANPAKAARQGARFLKESCCGAWELTAWPVFYDPDKAACRSEVIRETKGWPPTWHS